MGMYMLPSRLRVDLDCWATETEGIAFLPTAGTTHQQHSITLLLPYALMQLCNPSYVTCYVMNKPHCCQILLSTAAIFFILCRVLVFHFFLHHVMLNFTNICKPNTLQLRVCITILTGLAVSILCKLNVSILNFLNQAICLTEKEMNSCCNLYEYGTLR